MSQNKKGGRPPRGITDKERIMALRAMAFGMSIPAVAAMVGCAVNTLKKYISKEEIEAERTKLDTKLAQTLYDRAFGGDTAALIFLAKTRLKWRENAGVGDDDNGIPNIQITFATKES